MTYQTNKNVRIAKNTILLYGRSILILLISLYASRIVLEALGIGDFGIYNVVGGAVTMLGFFNYSLSSGIQRFINFELGLNGVKSVSHIFQTALTVQVLYSLLVFMILETVGVWFLNNQLSIPTNRMFASNWVFQFVIFSFVLSFMQAPFLATVIAYQRMNVFAYISIWETTAKLGIIFLLPILPFDKLVLYSGLLFIISALTTIIYIIYCKKNFFEIQIKFGYNKTIFNNLLSFSGWNLLGNLGYSLKEQGINIILNIFFGPVVNAARGISYQVSNGMQSFVANFQTAFRPQMIQSYSQQDIKYVNKLFLITSKFSFILMFIMVLPVFFEINFILKIWLGNNIPQYTSIFIRVVMLISLVDTLGAPVSTFVHATGNVKWYQIITTIIMLLILPVACFVLKLGYPPVSALIISLILTVVVQIARMIILKIQTDISLLLYLKKVVIPITVICIFSTFLPFLLYLLIPYGITRFVLVCIFSFISTIILTWFTINKSERNIFLSKIHVKVWLKLLRG